MRRLGLLCVCLMLAACGGGVSDKQALETYFTQHPDRDFFNAGRIRSVDCHRFRGLTFRGSQVYVCDVHYKRGDEELCAARVNGKIVRSGLPRSTCPIP